MSKTQKKHRTRGKNEPQQVGEIMAGLADNPEFILYNILKARKA
jgi:hypothetical protein